MSNHPQIQTQITHINGREIIAREPATGPHPHPKHNGQIVPFKNVYKGILDDDTEVLFCGTCGHVGPTTQSVASHRSGAHPKTPHQPETPEETIRAVLRAVGQARREGVRGYAARAAEVLNREGSHHPARGTEWTPGSVSRIYTQYRDTYRVRSARTIGSQTRARPVTRASVNENLDLARALDALRVLLKHTAEMVDVVERTAGQADPELARKAAKWDQLQQSLRD